MQDPYQKPKMTPFQEAMLKFEQALKESMEVEQARQREQNSRMAQQRPMTSARPAGQRPARPYPPGSPMAPTPVAKPQPMQPRVSDTGLGSYGDQSEAQSESRYQNVGEHAVIPTIYEPVTEMVSQVQKPAASFAESTPSIDSFQGHHAAANAADAAYRAIVPLAQTASPLMQGVIWAEVLGKPISRRKGRGRHGL